MLLTVNKSNCKDFELFVIVLISMIRWVTATVAVAVAAAVRLPLRLTVRLIARSIVMILVIVMIRSLVAARVVEEKKVGVT